MYLVKTPPLAKKIFCDYLWDIPTEEKVLYFTFDDGPIPEVTPMVLDILKDYSAQATFFCVGENIEKHPHIFQRILDENHAVGNHTHNHLNGWKTPKDVYINNVSKCQKLVNSKLFRPPYGKITREQANTLKSQYTIVMWDILCGDFDKKVTSKNCFGRMKKHAVPGSIIVLHDSIKTKNCVQKALPETLEFFQKQGYRFEKISL